MPLIDVDLDFLRCFVTVAETRNFTAAGYRLGRSQSAVSVRIKKLEDLLDAHLLERNSRDVTLTGSGRKLLPKAKSILAEGENLVAEMRHPIVSGKLRVGFLEYVAPHRIPEVLASFRRRLPDAELSFQVGLSRSLTAALDDGEIDMTLALHDPARQDSVPVAEDQLIWVESDANRGVSKNNALDLCLIQGPCVYRDQALSAIEETSRPFAEVMTANSILAVRCAVASGLGLSVLGESSLGDGIRRAQTDYRLPPLPRLKLALYGKDPRKEQLVETFQQILKNELSLV